MMYIICILKRVIFQGIHNPDVLRLDAVVTRHGHLGPRSGDFLGEVLASSGGVAGKHLKTSIQTRC